MTSRDQLLAWVQSESAQPTEPLVVGLTPTALRPAMAIASVQDGINDPSPVPSQNEWTGLAGRQGHTTVLIQRVSEPVSWASAVAKAQITDTGVTAGRSTPKSPCKPLTSERPLPRSTASLW